MVKITGWMEDHGETVVCESCGSEVIVYEYCPHCGSSIDVEEDDD